MARPAKFPKIELARQLAALPVGDQAEVIAFARELSGRSKAAKEVLSEKQEKVVQASDTKPVKRKITKRKGKVTKVEPVSGTEEQVEDAIDEVTEEEDAE